MNHLTRLTRLASQTPRFTAISSRQIPRYAHQSYGKDESGHPKDEKASNPSENLEHPGPVAPASKGSSSSSTSSSSSKKSDKGSPAIHSPPSAAEKTDPEVKKHNEDMKKRSDRSVNQLSEDDNKVDSKFWKGDVGPKKD